MCATTKQRDYMVKMQCMVRLYRFVAYVAMHAVPLKNTFITDRGSRGVSLSGVTPSLSLSTLKWIRLQPRSISLPNQFRVSYSECAILLSMSKVFSALAQSNRFTMSYRVFFVLLFQLFTMICIVLVMVLPYLFAVGNLALFALLSIVFTMGGVVPSLILFQLFAVRFSVGSFVFSYLFTMGGLIFLLLLFYALFAVRSVFIGILSPGKCVKKLFNSTCLAYLNWKQWELIRSLFVGVIYFGHGKDLPSLSSRLRMFAASLSQHIIHASDGGVLRGLPVFVPTNHVLNASDSSSISHVSPDLWAALPKDPLCAAFNKVERSKCRSELISLMVFMLAPFHQNVLSLVLLYLFDTCLLYSAIAEKSICSAKF